jgi:hypothetical protein
MVEVKSGMR